MIRRRERGVFAFATPQGPLGAMTAKYRLLRERGDWEGFQRTILPIHTLNYEPYTPCLDTDLSPEAMIVIRYVHEHIPDNVEKWMMQDIVSATNSTMQRLCRVYDSLGKDYVLMHFAPVAWATGVNPSKKELKEKINSIIG